MLSPRENGYTRIYIVLTACNDYYAISIKIAILISLKYGEMLVQGYTFSVIK